MSWLALSYSFENPCYGSTITIKRLNLTTQARTVRVNVGPAS